MDGRRIPLCDQARNNCRENPWLADLLLRYRPIAANLVRDCARLTELIPSPSIRSWGYANPYGCPVHGGTRAVFTYSLDRAGRAICSIGGEEYPNADFPDPDGSGWLDQRKGSHTEGQRYTFTADAYRYLWTALREACFACALDYLVHDDASAARACATVLEAMGAVYPRLDNRTCESWAPRTWHVPLTEHIMEGIFFRALAHAYLFIRESGELGAGRETIERDLFAHAGRIMRRIHADHPTLQAHNTAAFLLQGISLCGRAIGDTELVTYAAGAADGLLANGIWQDGFWNEGAVGYHAEVTRSICFLAEAILPFRNLYQDARLRRMIDFLFDLRSLETGATLALGDTLTDVDHCSFFAAAALFEWHDPRFVMNPDSFAWPASRAGESSPFPPALGDCDTVAFFLTRPLHAVLGRGNEAPSAQSRAGVSPAVSVLRQATGDRWLEAMMHHGAFCVGQTHGHSDKLSLALFGQGRAWLEEIGQTDGYLIPVYAGWSQNTVSHAAVMVDCRRQEPNPGGRLHLSYQGGRVSLADASAEDAYPGRVSLYRRCVFLARDPSDGTSYAIDLFRVHGGTLHDYSVHASASTFDTDGLEPGEKLEGTLAGLAVPYGDPGGFDLTAIMGYRGSGYQFLEHPARGRPRGSWQAVWRDGERGLALSMPGGNEVIIAEGRRFQRKDNGPRDLFTYLIVRREGEKDLGSDFMAVLEVFAGRPAVRSIRRLDSPGENGGAIACNVSRAGSEDFFMHDLDPQEERRAGPLCARGVCAYASLRDDGLDCIYLLGGTHASASGVGLFLDPSYEGVVAGIEPEAGVVVVRGTRFPEGATLSGQKLFIERPDNGATAYEIESVEGDRVRVRGGNLVFCTGTVGGYDAALRTIETRSPLLKLTTPGPQGRGTSILCAGWKSPIRITAETDFRDHGQPRATFRLALQGQPERHPVPGDPFTVLSVGPGDRVRVPAYACLERAGESAYRLDTDCEVRLSLPSPAGARLWARGDGEWIDCGDASGARVPRVRGDRTCALAVSLSRPV